MLERDMIKRGRNIVVSTIRGRKLRGRFERKFALIRDIVYFSFAAASLVGPLSAFRFISPARVMIRQYLPRWHMAKRKGGSRGGYYLAIFARCATTGHRKREKLSYISQFKWYI